MESVVGGVESLLAHPVSDKFGPKLLGIPLVESIGGLE